MFTQTIVRDTKLRFAPFSNYVGKAGSSRIAQKKSDVQLSTRHISDNPKSW